MPFSIVMLLRTPQPFSEEDLNAAGERAWDMPFSGESSSTYCVVPATAQITLIKAGKYLFNLLQEGSFYIGPVEETASKLSKPEQQQAWRQHTAWAAFDLMNNDVPKNEAYAALARWIVQLADQNCSGIYLPKASIFFPNNGVAEEGLRQLIRKGPQPS